MNKIEKIFDRLAKLDNKRTPNGNGFNHNIVFYSDGSGHINWGYYEVEERDTSFRGLDEAIEILDRMLLDEYIYHS